MRTGERVTAEQEQDGRVLHLRIRNAAKHNAIDAELSRDLGAAWAAFEASDARVAIISGDGPSFCSGAHLGDPPTDQACLPGIEVPVTKPVVAAVHGWCIGLGLVLSQLADLCVADATTQFVLPELRLGQTGGAVLHLAGRLPTKALFELVLGETVGAERAREMGLVNWVVSAGDHVDKAREVASRLAELEPATVRWIKPELLSTVPRLASADYLNVLDHIHADDENPESQRRPSGAS